MVALHFDAASVAPAPRLSVTFGRTRSEFRWSDRREMPFGDFADLLSRAEIGGKDGPCYTPAVFVGHARRMDQAARIDIAALDADCGHNLDEIRAAISHHGWAAVVHSTYSHLADQTIIAADACDRWLASHGGQTVANYMLAKKGYLPRVITDARIAEETGSGATRNYVVRHAPCPKFRIVLPLERPWIAAEYDSQALANATWKERIGALASALGLHHDQSCVDTSRLFYLPRRREGQIFVHEVIQGRNCPLWSLPGAVTATAAAPSPLVAASAAAPSDVPPGPVSHRLLFQGDDGQSIDLTQWAARFAARFEIVTALRARAPQLIGSRRSGVKQHIRCPSAADHITDANDQTGSFAVNASQLAQAGLPSITSGFVIHCMHNGCSGNDRLDHLKQLLCDGALSVRDLTAPAFLAPEAPLVDASALIAGGPVVRQGVAEKAGNIPCELYAELPGVMGEIHNFINATSPKPQPALNLGATLAFMAAAIGRRVQLQHWGVRPNIYVIGIAHSGAGKERALSAIKQMAQSAGLFSKLIGVEEVASDAGIIASVMLQPNQIMLLDEVGFLISAANNQKAGVHIVNVISTLLKLYSSSHTKFKGKSYADVDKVETVDQPCVSLYGCSTPAGLFAALSSKDVTNGLLSRVVLFDGGDHDPLGQPAAPRSVPETVLRWLRAWDEVSPIPNPVHREGGEPVVAPLTVPMAPEAMAVAEAFEIEMHAAKVKARSRGTDALYVRARENALKFALIRACAPHAVTSDAGFVVDRSALQVDGDTMRWAIALSRATIDGMEAGVREEIADTGFEVKLKNLRHFIRKAGPTGATLRDISRSAAGRLPQKEREDVLSSLCNAGEVFYVANVHAGKFCRPRPAYVHSDFIQEAGDED